MFEYHGWLVIRAAPYETETEDADEQAAVDFVRRLVDAEVRSGAPGLRDLRYVNGQAQFHFGGFRNRRTADFDDVLTAVVELARYAPGTFGLVHYHDDEDPVRDNEYRVLVIRRGEVTEQDDPFLSPVIPAVEDPWVDEDPRPAPIRWPTSPDPRGG